MPNQAQNPNQDLDLEQKQKQNQEQSLKKECCYFFNIKTLLVILIFITIIVAGYLIIINAIITSSKTDSSIINPIVKTQCKVDSDCELVYIGSNVCPPCDFSLEDYKCFNLDEAEKIKENRARAMCKSKPCHPEFDRYICKCANGKCEKVKEELVEGVIITTDKMEYEQGKTVRVMVKNYYSKKIFMNYLVIEENKKNTWTQIEEPLLWDGCRLTGGPYVFFKPEKTMETIIQKQWDCSFISTNLDVFSKKAISGIYRIKSEIINRTKSEVEDPNNILGKPSGKFIYSNEFTIKEKPTLDPRCWEKVVVTETCMTGIKTGLSCEFDLNLGKCIEKIIGSKCSFKTPFETLEKCQEVCEKKLDTSDWQTYRNEEFGFEFNYPKIGEYYGDEIKLFEKENVIKLCTEDSMGREYNFCHSLEIFRKLEEETVKDAIKRIRIKDKDQSVCFVKENQLYDDWNFKTYKIVDQTGRAGRVGPCSDYLFEFFSADPKNPQIFLLLPVIQDSFLNVEKWFKSFKFIEK